MSSAFKTFEVHYTSIKNLIRAADIYTIHSFARLQKRDVDLNHINKLMENESSFSTLVNGWYFHMSQDENDSLRKDPHIKSMCEQIVTSTYVAIEYYLVNRFEELIIEKVDDKVAKSLLKYTAGTSLNKLKEKYMNFLDINIVEFEPDVGLFENNWFNPKNCWEALQLMSKVRNEVAHTGTSNTYDITYLIDAYSPYHFTWRWVALFHSKTLNT
jgi:hypothetical protein